MRFDVRFQFIDGRRSECRQRDNVVQPLAVSDRGLGQQQTVRGDRFLRLSHGQLILSDCQQRRSRRRIRRVLVVGGPPQRDDRGVVLLGHHEVVGDGHPRIGQQARASPTSLGETSVVSAKIISKNGAARAILPSAL